MSEFRRKVDVNPSYTQHIQTDLLSVMRNNGENAYETRGQIPPMGLAVDNLTHTALIGGYIEQTNINKGYNKLLLFGKYQITTAGNDFFSIMYSITTPSSPTDIPTDLIASTSIRGTFQADTYYHFSHIVESIPPYITFKNTSADVLLNFEVYYTYTN